MRRGLEDQNERLRHFIRQLQRMQFGRRSEKLDPDQLALALEDLKQAVAEADAETARILTQEADPAVGEFAQAAVGDGDAMRIAAEILEHLPGSAERASASSRCAAQPGSSTPSAGSRSNLLSNWGF